MIPDYQTIMLPLLKIISDGNEHSTKEAVEVLGKEFNLSDDDLNEWLPSKKQKTFFTELNRFYKLGRLKVLLRLSLVIC